jgi:hypothetical protein
MAPSVLLSIEFRLFCIEINAVRGWNIHPFSMIIAQAVAASEDVAGRCS